MLKTYESRICFQDDDNAISSPETETETDAEKSGLVFEEVPEVELGETPAKTDEGQEEAPAGELTADEKSEAVEDAKKQHEKDGTWPEDTPQWVKDKINKTTRQKYKLKDENEVLKAENLALKEAKEEKLPEVGKRPDRADFEDEDEYLDSLLDWRDGKRRIDEAVAKKSSKTQTQAEDAQKSFQEKADSMMDSGLEKHATFAEVVTSVPGDLFRSEVIETILATESPDDVAWFLANNLDQAEKISKMSPLKRAAALGAICTRLSTPPTKKTTKAPEPIKPVGQKDTGPVDESKISDDEWLNRKRKERAA